MNKVGGNSKFVKLGDKMLFKAPGKKLPSFAVVNEVIGILGDLYLDEDDDEYCFHNPSTDEYTFLQKLISNMEECDTGKDNLPDSHWAPHDSTDLASFASTIAPPEIVTYNSSMKIESEGIKIAPPPLDQQWVPNKFQHQLGTIESDYKSTLEAFVQYIDIAGGTISANFMTGFYSQNSKYRDCIKMAGSVKAFCDNSNGIVKFTPGSNGQIGTISVGNAPFNDPQTSMGLFHIPALETSCSEKREYPTSFEASHNAVPSRKNCPQCTFFNDVNSIQCEMCEFIFQDALGTQERNTAAQAVLIPQPNFFHDHTTVPGLTDFDQDNAFLSTLYSEQYTDQHEANVSEPVRKDTIAEELKVESQMKSAPPPAPKALKKKSTKPTPKISKEIFWQRDDKDKKKIISSVCTEEAIAGHDNGNNTNTVSSNSKIISAKGIDTISQTSVDSSSLESSNNKSSSQLSLKYSGKEFILPAFTGVGQIDVYLNRRDAEQGLRQFYSNMLPGRDQHYRNNLFSRIELTGSYLEYAASFFAAFSQNMLIVSSRFDNEPERYENIYSVVASERQCRSIIDGDVHALLCDISAINPDNLYTLSEKADTLLRLFGKPCFLLLQYCPIADSSEEYTRIEYKKDCVKRATDLIGTVLGKVIDVRLWMLRQMFSPQCLTGYESFLELSKVSSSVFNFGLVSNVSEFQRLVLAAVYDFTVVEICAVKSNIPFLAELHYISVFVFSLLCEVCAKSSLLETIFHEKAFQVSERSINFIDTRVLAKYSKEATRASARKRIAHDMIITTLNFLGLNDLREMKKDLYDNFFDESAALKEDNVRRIRNQIQAKKKKKGSIFASTVAIASSLAKSASSTIGAMSQTIVSQISTSPSSVTGRYDFLTESDSISSMLARMTLSHENMIIALNCLNPKDRIFDAVQARITALVQRVLDKLISQNLEDGINAALRLISLLHFISSIEFPTSLDEAKCAADVKKLQQYRDIMSIASKFSLQERMSLSRFLLETLEGKLSQSSPQNDFLSYWNSVIPTLKSQSIIAMMHYLHLCLCVSNSKDAFAASIAKLNLFGISPFDTIFDDNEAEVVDETGLISVNDVILLTIQHKMQQASTENKLLTKHWEIADYALSLNLENLIGSLHFFDRVSSFVVRGNYHSVAIFSNFYRTHGVNAPIVSSLRRPGDSRSLLHMLSVSLMCPLVTNYSDLGEFVHPYSHWNTVSSMIEALCYLNNGEVTSQILCDLALSMDYEMGLNVLSILSTGGSLKLHYEQDSGSIFYSTSTGRILRKEEFNDVQVLIRETRPLIDLIQKSGSDLFTLLQSLREEKKSRKQKASLMSPRAQDVALSALSENSSSSEKLTDWSSENQTLSLLDALSYVSNSASSLFTNTMNRFISSAAESATEMEIPQEDSNEIYRKLGVASFEDFIKFKEYYDRRKEVDPVKPLKKIEQLWKTYNKKIRNNPKNNAEDDASRFSDEELFHKGVLNLIYDEEETSSAVASVRDVEVMGDGTENTTTLDIRDISGDLTQAVDKSVDVDIFSFSEQNDSSDGLIYDVTPKLSVSENAQSKPFSEHDDGSSSSVAFVEVPDTVIKDLLAIVSEYSSDSITMDWTHIAPVQQHVYDIEANIKHLEKHIKELQKQTKDEEDEEEDKKKKTKKKTKAKESKAAEQPKSIEQLMKESKMNDIKKLRKAKDNLEIKLKQFWKVYDEKLDNFKMQIRKANLTGNSQVARKLGKEMEQWEKKKEETDKRMEEMEQEQLFRLFAERSAEAKLEKDQMEEQNKELMALRQRRSDILARFGEFLDEEDTKKRALAEESTRQQSEARENEKHAQWQERARSVFNAEKDSDLINIKALICQLDFALETLVTTVGQKTSSRLFQLLVDSVADPSVGSENILIRRIALTSAQERLNASFPIHDLMPCLNIWIEAHKVMNEYIGVDLLATPGSAAQRIVESMMRVCDSLLVLKEKEEYLRQISSMTVYHPNELSDNCLIAVCNASVCQFSRGLLSCLVYNPPLKDTKSKFIQSCVVPTLSTPISNFVETISEVRSDSLLASVDLVSAIISQFWNAKDDKQLAEDFKKGDRTIDFLARQFHKTNIDVQTRLKFVNDIDHAAYKRLQSNSTTSLEMFDMISTNSIKHLTLLELPRPFVALASRLLTNMRHDGLFNVMNYLPADLLEGVKLCLSFLIQSEDLVLLRDKAMSEFRSDCVNLIDVWRQFIPFECYCTILIKSMSSFQTDSVFYIMKYLLHAQDVEETAPYVTPQGLPLLSSPFTKLKLFIKSLYFNQVLNLILESTSPTEILLWAISHLVSALSNSLSLVLSKVTTKLPNYQEVFKAVSQNVDVKIWAQIVDVSRCLGGNPFEVSSSESSPSTSSAEKKLSDSAFTSLVILVVSTMTLTASGGGNAPSLFSLASGLLIISASTKDKVPVDIIHRGVAALMALSHLVLEDDVLNQFLGGLHHGMESTKTLGEGITDKCPVAPRAAVAIASLAVDTRTYAAAEWFRVALADERTLESILPKGQSELYSRLNIVQDLMRSIRKLAVVGENEVQSTVLLLSTLRLCYALGTITSNIDFIRTILQSTSPAFMPYLLTPKEIYPDLKKECQIYEDFVEICMNLGYNINSDVQLTIETYDTSGVTTGPRLPAEFCKDVPPDVSWPLPLLLLRSTALLTSFEQPEAYFNIAIKFGGPGILRKVFKPYNASYLVLFLLEIGNSFGLRALRRAGVNVTESPTELSNKDDVDYKIATPRQQVFNIARALSKLCTGDVILERFCYQIEGIPIEELVVETVERIKNSIASEVQRLFLKTVIVKGSIVSQFDPMLWGMMRFYEEVFETYSSASSKAFESGDTSSSMKTTERDVLLQGRHLRSIEKEEGKLRIVMSEWLARGRERSASSTSSTSVAVLDESKSAPAPLGEVNISRQKVTSIDNSSSDNILTSSECELVSSFVDVKYEIIISEEALRFLMSRDKIEVRPRTVVLHTLQQIACGIFHEDYYMPIQELEGSGWDVQVYMAICPSIGYGIIWELGVGSPERDLYAETLLLKSTRSDDDGAIPVSQERSCVLVRVWNINFLSELQGNGGTRAIDNLRMSHLKGAQGSIRYERLDLRPPKPNHSDEEIQQLSSPNEHEKIIVYEMGHPDPNEFGVQRFYSLNSSTVACVLERELLSTSRANKLPFPFRLSPLEENLILNGGIKFHPSGVCSIQPMLLLGRSGTGKTTCCLYRMFLPYVKHWCDRLHQNSEETEIPLRQLFVTRNPVLRTEVMRNFHDILLCSGKICHDGTVIYPFPVPHGGFPSSPYIPKSLSCDESIPIYSWPLFLSSDELFRMIDGSLPGRPCFPGSSQGDSRNGESDTEFGSVRSYEEATLSKREPSKSSRTTKIKTVKQKEKVKAGMETHSQAYVAGRSLMTFEKFDKLLWNGGRGSLATFASKISSNVAHFSASAVWSNIKSVIKGSAECVVAGRHLSQEEFAELSSKRAEKFFENDRYVLYQIYKKYEEFKNSGENPWYDEMEVVLQLHKRIPPEGFQESNIQLIDQLFIDETQDFTQAELLLFWRLLKNPNECFLAGDTAQAIARGVTFRFEDIRAMAYELSSNSGYANILRGKECLNVPQPVPLAHNYRSHTGILNLAATVVGILQHYFRQSLDILPPDRGVFEGPKPRLLLSNDVRELVAQVYGRDHRKTATSLSLGARQAIIVRNPQSRLNLPPELQQATVLSVPESKGLEMDDVILFNFWHDSPAKDEWRLLVNYLQELRMKRERGEDVTLFTEGVLRDQIRGHHIASGFSAESHRLFESELKQLYVAVTRPRMRLWIFDQGDDGKIDQRTWTRTPVFQFLQSTDLVESILHGTNPEEFARVSDPSEHLTQAALLMKRAFEEQSYELYEESSERWKDGGKLIESKVCKAYGLKLKANDESLPLEAQRMKLEAASLFVEAAQSGVHQSILTEEVKQILLQYSYSEMLSMLEEIKTS